MEGSRSVTVEHGPGCTATLTEIDDVGVIEADPHVMVMAPAPAGIAQRLLNGLWNALFPKLYGQI